MNLSDFNYHLPPELIGQKAIEPRDSCKLMVVDRANNKISHHIFRDLVDILDKDTVLVLNDTKVFPARLFGTKETGGKIEVLLLKQITPDSFTCLVRGKVNNNQQVNFSSDLNATIHHCACPPLAEVGQAEAVQITFNISGPELLTQLDSLGKTPLPPYIHSEESENNLREQYQTVYAKEKGSAAAPTAGLHFTNNLLSKLATKGIQIETITLHVGLGTFKPVTDQQIKSKTLHSEQFEISHDTADRINHAKAEGKKIIAVGTTTCRVLESQTNEEGILVAGRGETNIFIQPSYKFKLLDGLITNFHFPQTSLLMLVTAFTGDFHEFNKSLIGRAYEEAIKNEYKFFSFGDSMIII